jgi:hypothetical protein
MTALQNTIGFIIDNYSDAIEGGNSYRGSGTAYNGICGAYSHNEHEDTAITATSGSTTTIVDTAFSDSVGSAAVRTDAPPFFALCSSQATLTRNTGAARKITAYATGTNTFTVAPAFTDAVAATDVFALKEGFKRAPDNIDINGDGEAAGGFDRFFRFEMMPGKLAGWFGNGREQYESTLEIQLRIMKRSRDRNAVSSAMENVLMFRSILPRGAHRDGTYTQNLSAMAEEPKILDEDEQRVIVSDKYAITYRVSADFL